MKKLISMLVAALLAAGLGGCTSENDLITVNLNEVAHSIFYAPQYIAMEKGFFEQEGLEINLSLGNGADRSMAALISGEADIALMGSEAGLYVYNEGREDHAVAFAQLTQRAGNFLVSRTNDEDFSWQDVKGKTIIGGRAGGMPQMVLEYILRQNGIDPVNDLEILTNLQYATTAGAFTGGIGDYTAEFDPSAYAIEKAGAGYVVSSMGTDSGFLPYTVYQTLKSYFAENGDTIQRFTNAIYRAELWMAEHSPEEIAEAIAKQFPESTLEDLTFMIERYQEVGAYRTTPVFSEEDLDLFQEIMTQSGMLDKKVPFNDFVDNTYALKAVETVK